MARQVTDASRDRLSHGRDAYRRRAWEAAYQSLWLADQTTPLAVDDVELLSTAAYLTGRDDDFQRLVERAHRAHLEAGSHERAARSAFWLGLTLYFRGEAGQANGWLARARRLINDRDCVEQGYLLLPLAEHHLIEGKVDPALVEGEVATEMGTRFGDADLLACARHLHGRALIAQGRINPGLALLDEAMLAAVGGDLSPVMTGLIYCSVIEVCQRIYAVSRAREWTDALARWCDQQPDMIAFNGTCRVYRAEIMRLHGDWSAAIDEASRACERFSRGVERRPPAGAFYQLGETHRLRGEFAEAEEAYRQASRSGAEPQPGLALLRAAQGRTDAACAAIQRVVEGADDPLQRARLIPSQIDILLAVGKIEEASGCYQELERIASRFDTPVLWAISLQRRGAVELAGGDSRAALVALRAALDLWGEAEVPYEAARVRVMVGLACQQLGDDDAAELELSAARAEFDRLGARPDAARLDLLHRRGTAQPKHGLTARELEVLRLVAGGKTNKAIATTLRLSDRTIDRHMSNILRKLGVATRAAATASAFSQKLI